MCFFVHRIFPEGYTRNCQHWLPEKGNGCLGHTGGIETYLSLFYNVHVYLVNRNKSFQNKTSLR